MGVYFYAIVYQAQDEEDYGGAWEVLKEGMLTSSAFFVVSDILNRYKELLPLPVVRSTGSYGTQPAIMDETKLYQMYCINQ